MKEKDPFDFESCWTCLHCLLDIGLGQYCCGKRKILLAPQGKRSLIVKPTDCPHWTNNNK